MEKTKLSMLLGPKLLPLKSGKAPIDFTRSRIKPTAFLVFFLGWNAITQCMHVSVAFSRTQIEGFISFPWPVIILYGFFVWCGGLIMPDSLHLLGSLLKSIDAKLQPTVLSSLASWHVHCESSKCMPLARYDLDELISKGFSNLFFKSMMWIICSRCAR